MSTNGRHNPFFVAVLGLVVLLGTFSTTFAYIFRERLFPTPTAVIVYGTEECGFTRQLRRGLDEAGVPYVFVDVDGPYNFQEMQARLGVGTDRFTSPTIRLPVVYQGGVAQERPSLAHVLAEHSRLVSATVPD